MESWDDRRRRDAACSEIGPAARGTDRASQVASAFPGRLAWQTRPVALVLTLRTPPAVVPTRSNNRLGSELIRSAVANRRRRAPPRLRTRLPPDAGADSVQGTAATTRDAYTSRPMTMTTGKTSRAAGREVNPSDGTKNVAERIPSGGLPISHPDATSTYSLTC